MGVYDDLKEAAHALRRLTEAEKRLAQVAADTRAATKDVADRLNDLLGRQARLEVRMENLETNLQAQAAAAASVAASSAVGREMLEIGTRLGRIEAALTAPGRLARLPPAD